jgi:Tfp pilus assembly protein PilP
MKAAMTIFVCVVAAGLTSAQNPSVVQNTRGTMKSVNNQATAASNQALDIRQSAPAAAGTTHAPAKPGRVAVAAPAKLSVAPANASSAPAKREHRAKRVRAIVVDNNAPPKPAVAVSEPNVQEPVPVAGEKAQNEQPIVPDSVSESKYAANGRRDPFLSPVVTQAGGSGCSTGKKCLDIGTINLRGVVRAESGFIAVVSNGLNKAYFLRENDPVFNGYVVKITGDSIVFQETLQDRLGKSFTREVVKKISAPAA